VPHEHDPNLPIDPDLDDVEFVGTPGYRPPSVRHARDAATRRSPAVLAAIAVGGALGAPARYEVAQLIHVAKNTFPWATFWTNVSGSFALGFFMVLLVRRLHPAHYVRAFVATGFLGAFTTFSTFAVETDLLIKNGEPALGVVYAVSSLGAGFVAVWVGMSCARRAPARDLRAVA